ncbi:YciI family protein [Paraburkholderia sp. A3BS-1L]|uniref:YciI family protein n=1 Tax=Paraburkholderia sp. A3BS-1L TaxID=3028375 RepID=UPI003DA8FA3F
MYFLVFAGDWPDAHALRSQTKARHSAHLDAGAPGVRVLQSGPWLNGEGREAGSLLIVEAGSQEAVEAFLRADPYFEAGLFAHYAIHPWVWRRGNPFVPHATGAADQPERAGKS